MSDGRLTASVEAASLVRRAQGDGGFAAILRKGDPDRGAILIVVRSPAGYAGCLQRTLAADGRYQWASVGPEQSATDEMVAEFLAKQVRFDADLWLIELDIAHPERFIAETISAG